MTEQAPDQPDQPDPGRGAGGGSRRALRIVLWTVGVLVVVSGFALVGFFVLVAVGLNQWASNK